MICVYAIVNIERLCGSLFFSCNLSDNIMNLRATFVVFFDLGFSRKIMVFFIVF